MDKAESEAFAACLLFAEFRIAGMRASGIFGQSIWEERSHVQAAMSLDCFSVCALPIKSQVPVFSLSSQP